MGDFLSAATSYPTAIYTTLLGVVMIYWLLAIVGAVDFEQGSDLDLDLGHDSDVHVDGIGTLAGYLVALGLNGVPFSVVVSLIVLLGWMMSCLAGMWALPLVPTALLRVAVATGVLFVSFAASIPITARVIRPLRGLFVSHGALANAALIGQPCRITTGTVDEQFGRAEVAQRGANLNIRVWATSPNTLKRGANALIIDYDPQQQRYQVEAAP